MTCALTGLEAVQKTARTLRHSFCSPDEEVPLEVLLKHPPMPQQPHNEAMAVTVDLNFHDYKTECNINRRSVRHQHNDWCVAA
jgi:hypothetical protein